MYAVLAKSSGKHGGWGREKLERPTAVKADVLLVTVNEHETQAILTAFAKATGAGAKPVPVDDRIYRDLGVINGTRIYHALSEMGSAGPGATQQTVDKGIRALKPEAVIPVGIAFGVSEKKQAISDILVSEQLRLYDLQRAAHEIILRGDKPNASPPRSIFSREWRKRPGRVYWSDQVSSSQGRN